MTSDANTAIIDLPRNLKARLELIIQNVPQFWENCPHYPHFNNHSSTHSEHIHHFLAQLAQELPLSSQLTADEVFIVSAAAYLYETGLQSPNMKPVLDFDFQPGLQLSPQQLLEIQHDKHLLSQKLILESVSSEYRGQTLGLSVDDDYTHLIAEVCRWISGESLDDVPEMLPVHGVPVRVRLIVALLRLADQLYIDKARINFDLLERADLPMRQFARWWAYQYTQTLPIEKGQIRFHYFLPFNQREYLGHLRALIEPAFEFDKNPTLHFLLDKYGLKLIPPHTPSLGRYDQTTSFQRPMSGELIAFLRQEIPAIPTPSVFQPEPVMEDAGECVLVLDYENFIIQLGLEGYFLTEGQVNHYVAQLRSHAVREHEGTITGWALGPWGRPDLAETSKMLEKWVYSLIAVEANEDPADILANKLIQKSQTEKPPKRTILVAPHADLARTVLHLVQSQQLVSTWITNTSDAVIFQGGFGQRYNTLSRMLGLGKPQPLQQTEFEACEAACFLRLQSELEKSSGNLSLEKMRGSLEFVERLDGQAAWWQLWLLNQKILISDPKQPNTFQINLEHGSVKRASQMRTRVLEALQALSVNGEGVAQDQLLKQLRNRDVMLFRQDPVILNFLELLKDEELIRRDANPLLTSQPLWFLNTAHKEYLALNPEYYLAPFAVTFDHIMLREGHHNLHEHNLLRLISPYVGEEESQAVYELAQANDWVYRRDTGEKLHRGEGNLVFVGLNERNVDVGKALRNRNILLNYLNNRYAKDGLEREILWQRLHGINAFSLDETEFDLLIDLLARDGIVVITTNSGDSRKDLICLDKQASLTQSLIGRMHLYGLIRTLRRLGATRPDKKRSTEEIMDALMRYVTKNKEDVATWTVEYAFDIQLIEIPGGKRDSDGKIPSLWLARHPIVSKLDRREDPICKNLADLVKSLTRGSRDGWVPQPVVYSEMDKGLQFGYSREEQEYWMDQAIYRRKMLEVDKQKDNRNNNTYFVRATSR